MIRGQHFLRTNQWNHPVLGCVTGGDIFSLPADQEERDVFWLREPNWGESLTDGSSLHCLLDSSLVGGDLFRRCFRAFEVREGSSVISWFPGDCQNHEGENCEKICFWIFFQFNPYFEVVKTRNSRATGEQVKVRLLHVGWGKSKVCFWDYFRLW